MATLESLKADVSSVNPLLEQLEELWIVYVYEQKVELRYWWEYSDNKTMYHYTLITLKRVQNIL